jgi:hypothetical protein
MSKDDAIEIIYVVVNDRKRYYSVHSKSRSLPTRAQLQEFKYSGNLAKVALIALQMNNNSNNDAENPIRTEYGVRGPSLYEELYVEFYGNAPEPFEKSP